MKNYLKRLTFTSETISDNLKSFEIDEKMFLFHLKRFFLLRRLNFCPDFFGRAEKQLNKKAMI